MYPIGHLETGKGWLSKQITDNLEATPVHQAPVYTLMLAHLVQNNPKTFLSVFPL